MFALLDATHPRRTELVQAGVADVASRLRPRDPIAPDALVLFPEDVGLVAGLIGSRGAAARSVTVQTGGSTTAFFLLTAAYQPQVEYYQQRYPGLPGLATCASTRAATAPASGTLPSPSTAAAFRSSPGSMSATTRPAACRSSTSISAAG
jgi:hypothetical protein